MNKDLRDRTGCSSWYALYARHQHEKSIVQLLTAKGFETLLIPDSPPMEGPN
jgi:hypothetical protein